jgi:hypothetical protein
LNTEDLIHIENFLIVINIQCDVCTSKKIQKKNLEICSVPFLVTFINFISINIYNITYVSIGSEMTQVRIDLVRNDLHPSNQRPLLKSASTDVIISNHSPILGYSQIGVLSKLSYLLARLHDISLPSKIIVTTRLFEKKNSMCRT